MLTCNGRRHGVLYRAVYRNATFLFPRTEFLRRLLIEDYGCDPQRVVVVGYGANFTAPSLEDRRYGSQTALFVGIDFTRKGGPLLLQIHRTYSVWNAYAHPLSPIYRSADLRV